MKHSILLLFAVLFCFGGLTNAQAASPTMDLSYYYWHRRHYIVYRVYHRPYYHHYYRHYYWRHGRRFYW